MFITEMHTCVPILLWNTKQIVIYKYILETNLHAFTDSAH